jgi:hypothetical protein
MPLDSEVVDYVVTRLTKGKDEAKCGNGEIPFYSSRFLFLTADGGVTRRAKAAQLHVQAQAMCVT